MTETTSATNPATGPVVDPGDLTALAASFGSDYGVDFADPDAVREWCAEISEAFAEHCRAAGLAAQVVCGGQYGEMPQFPGVRLLFHGHCATLVVCGEEDRVYDWTARQFDPHCPVPLVCTLAQWRGRWAPIA